MVGEKTPGLGPQGLLCQSVSASRKTLFKVISGLGVQESRRSDPPSNPKRESWFLDFFGSPQGLQPLYPPSPLLMNTCSVIRNHTPICCVLFDLLEGKSSPPSLPLYPLSDSLTIVFFKALPFPHQGKHSFSMN